MRSVFRKRRVFLPLLLLFFCVAGRHAFPFTLWFSLVLSPLRKQYFPTMALALTGRPPDPASLVNPWKAGPQTRLAEADVVPSASLGKRKRFAARGLRKLQAKGLDRRHSRQADGAPRGTRGSRSTRTEVLTGASFARMMNLRRCAGWLTALLAGLREKFRLVVKHEERHVAEDQGAG